MAGPLEGLKVVELAGIGPGPFCAMMLADLGAKVIRIQRPGAQPDPADVTTRGRDTITLDLRDPEAVERVLGFVDRSDVLIEGFRPGVMERLGLGPERCLERNESLIYGRMTGWGQYGPLAKAAGHDLNYIALSGALHAMGRPADPPAPPLNLVGDFGGGAMLLAVGLLAALFERNISGRGQVIDAAMTDGSALLATMFYGLKGAGHWTNQRGENLLDGGAYFYDTYACADGKYVAIGAIEPQFHAELLRRCGLEDEAFDDQMDRARWPLLKMRLADVFRIHARDEWCAILEGTDVCFAPVLDWDEAPEHPHNRARETFVSVDGIVQPAPAPRFSRTPPAVPTAARISDPDCVSRDWGLSARASQSLRVAKAL